MRYYVYVFIDPRTNLPFYVGKGSGRRATRHLNKAKAGELGENPHFYNKIRKIYSEGSDPLIEFVLRTDDEEAAYATEEMLIRQFRRVIDGGTLTNICFDRRPPSMTGTTWEGMYGAERAAEKRQEMSQRSRAYYAANPDWEKRVGEEVAAQLREEARARGRKFAAEGAPYLFKKGHVLSAETRSKMSTTRTGAGNGMHGRRHSEGARRLMSERHHDCAGALNANAKRFVIQSPTGELYTVVGSLTKFCAEHNLEYTTLLKTHSTGRAPNKGRTRGWLMLSRELASKTT